MCDALTLLALPQDWQLSEIRLTPTIKIASVVSAQVQSCCPLCGSPSQSVHSRYTRILADLPCADWPLRIELLCRKFICRNALCARKIFTERFPTFLQPWARMTERLSQALEHIALATSGEQGARLAVLLDMPSSPTTLLRRVMDLPSPAAGDVEAVGIDDWALRRGRVYGSVLVNLETHDVIDLLPDRTAATAEAWFRSHPEITIVSRDRGGEYAAAARAGAPQATQVADRFHLVKNLTEATELVLGRCRPQLRQAALAEYGTSASLDTEAPAPVVGSSQASSPIAAEDWRPHPHPSTVKKTEARRTQRLDRYTQAIELRAQGHTLSDIARQIGRCERTVRKWLQHGSYPEVRCPKRRSVFDPYARYILQRWSEGIQNSQQLFTEIQAQGYPGTLRTLQRFLARLHDRPKLPSPPELPADDILQRFSTKDAVWLFMRQPSVLDEQAQADLARIRAASPMAETAYQLVQDFLQIVHRLEGTRLDAWLTKMIASEIPEFQRFAAGIERDKAAVVAGLTLPYSNGQVEGQVTKIKLVKRMMYGRAGFPLLRQRVLHAI